MNKHRKNSPSSRQILDIRTRIGAIIPIAAAAVVGSYQSTEYRRVDADLLAKAASSAHASTAMSIEKISERHVEKNAANRWVRFDSHSLQLDSPQIDRP